MVSICRFAFVAAATLLVCMNLSHVEWNNSRIFVFHFLAIRCVPWHRRRPRRRTSKNLIWKWARWRQSMTLWKKLEEWTVPIPQTPPKLLSESCLFKTWTQFPLIKCQLFRCAIIIAMEVIMWIWNNIFGYYDSEPVRRNPSISFMIRSRLKMYYFFSVGSKGLRTVFIP